MPRAGLAAVACPATRAAARCGAEQLEYGALRADFTPEDSILLLEAVAGIIRQTGTAASAATERFIALALDGFRAEGATPAPPPISRRQIRAGRRDSRRKHS
jgi:hypothetical protein